MDPAYDPRRVEARWYPRWEAAGVFRPEVNPDGDPYCIVIPPPNVTGSLHMGHALDQTIQDVIIRRKRMQGYAALWLPGTDHAGIATQIVVERELAREGVTREELGRERFIEQVWAWKAKSGGRITEQIRRMGFSTDWSRERFTMDDGLSAAVRKVFVDLYHEGLIYRGRRIINWCPRDRTALSDVEVEHEEEQGELVRIRYPFADGDGGIEVATTRAETMLGDTAVAVHPGDERYRSAVGRTVRLPLLGREIPVVADDAVDPGFGTGAVKVTPAHDATDFEIGQRHGLEAPVVIDEGGAITEEGGPFAGLDRVEARRAVKEALEAEGVLVGVEDHPHSVGHCQRCHTVVEPFLSEQWFVKVGPLVGPAIAAVTTGDIRFVPERWEKTYLNWLENLRDWCISRQIWWGHRIPAWYCDSCGGTIVSIEDPSTCGCGSTELHQDEDVLDTWFSSGLFPFSTLGWPEDTADYARFYPNATLVTGYDIISFWVARMIQFGLHLTGSKPFSDVVIHGLIRAGDGRKMSKSLGNTVDPLEVVEEHGADALRLALILAAAPGQDVPFQVEWVDAARRFGNKVWNAARFALGHLDERSVPSFGGYPESPGPEASWILSRLHHVRAEFDRMLDEYRLGDAYGLLYKFAWSEVFDWFLELAKAPLRDGDDGGVGEALGVVMRDLLLLLHPAMPYLTEELWSHFVGDGFAASARWPEPPEVEAPAGFDEFRELVVGIRRFRAEHGLSPRRPLDVLLIDPEGLAGEWWGRQFVALAGVSPRAVADAPKGAFSRVVAGSAQALIALEDVVDVGAERARLDTEIADLVGALDRSHAKLGNPQFVERAPEAVVEKERQRVTEIEAVLEKLRLQLADLG
ncbi:MAG: valine--tRNA ligase [Acidimicrobiia bacterium]|nr:MAG: valine--tRNA ligase [Acidimicrobiia bacterium]